MSQIQALKNNFKRINSFMKDLGDLVLIWIFLDIEAKYFEIFLASVSIFIKKNYKSCITRLFNM